jgi:hypothetical protein
VEILDLKFGGISISTWLIVACIMLFCRKLYEASSSVVFTSTPNRRRLHGAPVRESFEGPPVLKCPRAQNCYRGPLMTLPCAPTILVMTHRPNDDGNNTKARR